MSLGVEPEKEMEKKMKVSYVSKLENELQSGRSRVTQTVVPERDGTSRTHQIASLSVAALLACDAPSRPPCRSLPALITPQARPLRPPASQRTPQPETDSQTDTETDAGTDTWKHACTCAQTHAPSTTILTVDVLHLLKANSMASHTYTRTHACTHTNAGAPRAAQNHFHTTDLNGRRGAASSGPRVLGTSRPASQLVIVWRPQRLNIKHGSPCLSSRISIRAIAAAARTDPVRVCACGVGFIYQGTPTMTDSAC
jgi:hypothetical protein